MALFADFDTDKNGMISLDKLRGATVKVGPSEASVLKQMKEMDLNDDGYVEAYEWETYFATMVDVLNDSELDSIMADLTVAGRTVATVAMCTKLAAEGDADAGTAEVDAEDAQAAAEELEAATLGGEQKALVEELFKEWDFNGDGKIDRGKLQTTGVEVGPRKEKVFSAFEKMDINDDKVVTLDEMLLYFGMVATLMSEDQFKETVGEMREMAATEKSVLTMIGYAEQAAQGEYTELGEEDDEPEPVVELTAARLEQISALFLVYSSDTSKPIELAALSAAKVEAGPSKMSVLEGMKLMDENGDGMVELSEMQSYFKLTGAALSDEEFALVLDSLKDGAAAGESMKLALEVATS